MRVAVRFVPGGLVALGALLAAPFPAAAQAPVRDAPPAVRPVEPEPPFPYRTEPVRYRNQDARLWLEGTLTIPEGEGPFPAVALVSGSGAQDRDSELFGHRVFLVLADHLTRRGIAVLRSDDRGTGTSDGDFGAATTEDFASDAAAAAAWLRGREEVRPGAVGLVGMSEGGLAAALVAAEGDGIAFLVLLGAPGVPGREILLTQSALIAQRMGAPAGQVAYNRAVQERAFAAIEAEADPAARAERLAAVFRQQFAELAPAERSALGLDANAEEAWIRAQVEEMGRPWFRFFLLHDPRPVLQRVRVPVLALGGTLDLQVPPEPNLREIRDALEAGGNADVVVEALPGLNHLLQRATTGVPAEYRSIPSSMDAAALERVAGWILERFGAGR